MFFFIIPKIFLKSYLLKKYILVYEVIFILYLFCHDWFMRSLPKEKPLLEVTVSTADLDRSLFKNVLITFISAVRNEECKRLIYINSIDSYLLLWFEV